MRYSPTQRRCQLCGFVEIRTPEGEPFAGKCADCGGDPEACPRCRQSGGNVEEQYSFGVYAGRMCEPCAIAGYRDGCGLIDGQQGSAADLDEPLEADDY